MLTKCVLLPTALTILHEHVDAFGNLSEHFGFPWGLLQVSSRAIPRVFSVLNPATKAYPTVVVRRDVGVCDVCNRTKAEALAKISSRSRTDRTRKNGVSKPPFLVQKSRDKGKRKNCLKG